MDEVHEQASVVAGYVACVTCADRWVTREYARWHRGQCELCFIAAGRELRRGVEIVARGARVTLPTGRRHKTKVKAKNKAGEKAKERARKRLAAMFPDLYQILLAEERAELGLTPYPGDWDVRRGEDPSGEQTQAFLALYHHLDERGVAQP